MVTAPRRRLGHANVITAPTLYTSERSGLRTAVRVALTLQPLQLGTQGMGSLPLLLRLRQGRFRLCQCRFFRLAPGFRTL
jgi:hypothetical protein